jgi:site-specific DNA-cytosine methylase
MVILNQPGVRIIRHAHLFCGVGAGAKGFNMAKARVGAVQAKFVCTGGIDVDPGAIRNFERLTGVKGTCLDLFSLDQYIAFHGRMPPTGWREATPADVRRALSGPNGERPDVIFLSAPCKGFSGLLSQKQSLTDKYQALNGLTLRGVWLVCEAFKDGPIPVILFENVPRIMTRGRPLLDQISAILRSYSYNCVESVHDCGELGNLAQSRKRFLLLARQRDVIPNFIYQPQKSKLRGVGEVIGKLPLPGDPVGGPMHRVPLLQFKTWLRLALVPAGRDWRALNELAVENGVLRDYGIIPEFQDGQAWRDNGLGVCAWGDKAPLITGQRSPYQGRFSVADVRPGYGDGTHQNVLHVSRFTSPAKSVISARHVAGGAQSVADPRLESGRNTAFGVLSMDDSSNLIAGESMPSNGAYAVADPRLETDPQDGCLGVVSMDASSFTIRARSGPTNGAFSIADPRPGYGSATHRYVLGVLDWTDSAGVLGCSPKPTSGANAIADPRCENGHPRSVMLGVRAWESTSACVKGDMSVGTGPYAIADVRLQGRPRFNNTFRIVKIDQAAQAVAGPGGPAGGACVADPRPDRQGYDSRKYKITTWDSAARAVIGASTTGDGAFALADPRGPMVGDAESRKRASGKYPVAMWIGPSQAVIGGRDQGAFAVADPRCNWGNRHENVLRVTSDRDPAGAITSGGHSVTGGQPIVADSRREHYQTCGHYGVVPWTGPAGTVSATIGHDNGPGSVADPRPKVLDVDEPIVLPKPEDRLVCRIVSLDECWHRPFTTLELAALQSILDPDEVFYQDEAGAWRCRYEFDLESSSDAEKREWIGNAVPSESARGIAETIGETLILADQGETFTLSNREIWCNPMAMAVMVDDRQTATTWDMN